MEYVEDHAAFRARPEITNYLDFDEEPNAFDVICERGVTGAGHEGNREFTLIIMDWRPLYSGMFLELDDHQKRSVVQKIYNYIKTGRGQKGRFVSRDKTTKRWYEATTEASIKRVAQALRDVHTPIWAYELKLSELSPIYLSCKSEAEKQRIVDYLFTYLRGGRMDKGHFIFWRSKKLQNPPEKKRRFRTETTETDITDDEARNYLRRDLENQGKPNEGIKYVIDSGKGVKDQNISKTIEKVQALKISRKSNDDSRRSRRTLPKKIKRAPPPSEDTTRKVHELRKQAVTRHPLFRRAVDRERRGVSRRTSKAEDGQSSAMEKDPLGASQMMSNPHSGHGVDPGLAQLLSLVKTTIPPPVKEVVVGGNMGRALENRAFSRRGRSHSQGPLLPGAKRFSGAAPCYSDAVSATDEGSIELPLETSQHSMLPGDRSSKGKQIRRQGLKASSSFSSYGRTTHADVMGRLIGGDLMSSTYESLQSGAFGMGSSGNLSFNWGDSSPMLKDDIMESLHRRCTAEMSQFESGDSIHGELPLNDRSMQLNDGGSCSTISLPSTMNSLFGLPASPNSSLCTPVSPGSVFSSKSMVLQRRRSLKGSESQPVNW